MEITANKAFLKAFRYIFIYAMSIIGGGIIALTLFRGGGEINLLRIFYTFLIAFSASSLIGFLIAYFGVKEAIKAGEVANQNMFKENGKLSLNFFRKQS